ncbi:HAL/PAL/TAL family ammonia-lyase [Mesonia oceanica]|uniref:Tyrosine 2,3-aminomutase n=1 Tax=Mesonia oceanica TaxID=2687242 RepID=A0AC61Y4L5_9FLAO|nr:aromatic amino acid ammonia-lyase [Mesonia oceanica]MAQ40795.1 histidine ammonia-lyase [Mesonia sp.]MBJ97716.1 histidine ammonia-lyase [Flavobacteriaceae bacterium]VVU99421.1 Tyrosine 2,3-aminomutase [Mesonia oceanica]|tara:strand:+ start:1476 stop:3008 length:1533 start_codon:yes stop_codon:yes gene_type:complete
MPKAQFSFSFSEFKAIIFQHKEVEISDATLQKMKESFQFLKSFSEDKVIYGVNTGFGPMAQYRIPKESLKDLQYNLIRSHASGTGNILNEDEVKAVMLARLQTLSLGKSGIPSEVILLMKELINREIYPVIFEHGGVGASGDLVQLAHLALVLVGEGEVFYKGERKTTAEVFKVEQLQPISIQGREGLALINGTSVMTGIGLLNFYYSERLLDWSIFTSSLLNELVGAYDDHFSAELNNAKLHIGQQAIAKQMREFLKGSKRIKKREAHLYKSVEEEVFKEKVQEYYSLRCVPQILGPIKDTYQNVLEVLMNEVNSANDNPIVDLEKQQVYHGGNFHGDYIALEMDKMRLATTKLSMLIERQINYMMNAKLNDIFPPFLNNGKLGLNFGMQGAQFSAVSTTAENQTLSNSMYIHSISNNNDNQDIVSMGTNAANLTKRVIHNSYEVLAVQVISLVQAAYFLDQDKDLAPETGKILQQFKSFIPQLKEDQPLYPLIQETSNYLKNHACYEN